MELWPQRCAEDALMTNVLRCDEGILKTLDAAVKKRADNGESALRIALSDDLLQSAEDWYQKGSEALRVEINNAKTDWRTRQPLLQALNRYPYPILRI